MAASLGMDRGNIGDNSCIIEDFETAIDETETASDLENLLFSDDGSGKFLIKETTTTRRLY